MVSRVRPRRLRFPAAARGAQQAGTSTAPSDRHTPAPRASHHHLSPNCLSRGKLSLLNRISQETSRFEELTLDSSPPAETGAFAVKLKHRAKQDQGPPQASCRFSHSFQRARFHPVPLRKVCGRKAATPPVGKEPRYAQGEGSNCSLSPSLSTGQKGFQSGSVAV